MIGRRRRALRAAVFGVFGALGLLVAVPGAYAATCFHTGGPLTTTLTFVPTDGTVTLSQDANGALTYAAAGEAPSLCGAATVDNTAQMNVVGSAAASVQPTS